MIIKADRLSSHDWQNIAQSQQRVNMKHNPKGTIVAMQRETG